MKSSNQVIANADNTFIQRMIIALMLGSILLGLAIQANAVTIKSSISPLNLTIGDRLVLTNTVELIPGQNLEPMTPEEKLGDAMVLSKVYKLAKPPAGTEVYACTLGVYQSGLAKIASLSFRSPNDTTIYMADTISTNVKSVLPLDTAGLQIADIKGPRKIRGPIWPYLLAIAILALVIFAIIKLKRYWRRRIEAPVIPPVPPWDAAIQKLEALKAERYLDFGKFKEFYFELSLIIRGYIEGRYETPAAESTTYELEDNEIIKSITPELYSPLFDFFVRADLVKFAKSIPTARDAEKDMSFAYDFVIKTKPAPVVETISAQPPEEVKV
jgi:hypothetical protein